MAQARIYSDVNERMRAFRKRKRNAVDPNVTPPSVTLSPKRNAPKHNAAEPSVTPDGMSPGARRGRIGRAHDKQIAQLIADELRAMGASSSEPKALKNAVDRVKPGLSVLDQTRSDE